MGPEQVIQQRDRDALTRALVIARQDPMRAEQLDRKLANGESWDEVATFAALCVQSNALHLKPWQCPPCDSNNEIDPSEGVLYGNRPDEVALLQRMLAAGLSRFEPDPMKALAEAEAKTAANPA
jgi:hypothetical protein